MRRCHRLGLVTAAAVVVVTSILAPTWAWARYNVTGVAGGETNTFQTVILATPTIPTCSGLGIASSTVTFSWTVSVPTKIVSYAIDQSSSLNGTYTAFVANTNSTATSYGPFTIPGSAAYYKIRALNHSWTSPPSPAEKLTPGLLGFLLPSCSP
jgi:hypothetical protein